MQAGEFTISRLSIHPATGCISPTTCFSTHNKYYLSHACLGCPILMGQSQLGAGNEPPGRIIIDFLPHRISICLSFHDVKEVFGACSFRRNSRYCSSPGTGSRCPLCRNRSSRIVKYQVVVASWFIQRRVEGEECVSIKTEPPHVVSISKCDI